MRHFSLRRPLMTYRTGRWPWALTCLVAAVTLGAVALTSAQEKPRSGGELIFVVPAEPPSFDAHREETFGMLHPAAPHYNTLLRVDPFDKTGTKFIGDLAESWTVSSDKRTFTFKLRRGVKFHDGSLMTSADRKSTRLNSSHGYISYAVFCLKKKNNLCGASASLACQYG